MSERAPDSIEPYVGWKALRVDWSGHLYSPQVNTNWPIGKRLEAECNHGDALYMWEWIEVKEEEAEKRINETEDMPAITFASIMPLPQGPLKPGYTWIPQPITMDHEPVAELCSCGIYAVTDRSYCHGYLKPDCILAQVAIWGRTVIATGGVRGQYAYPQKLIAPERLREYATLAGENYGAEVVIDDAQIPQVAKILPIPSKLPPSHPSLAPLVLALLFSFIVATLALFQIGSFLLSMLASAVVVAAIIYTKFG